LNASIKLRTRNRRELRIVMLANNEIVMQENVLQ
jgi:hypothetical protein